MMVVSSEYKHNWSWCGGVGMSLIYRLKRQGKSNHPAPPQRACHENIMWKSGRTFKRPKKCTMKRFGRGRTRSLGSLACEGSHRPKRHQILWSRRGKPRLLATFSRSALPGSKPKLLVSHQPALDYFLLESCAIQSFQIL
jgi:hypothetical protein